MNCKPGDLAFIAGDEDPENIGIIVRVVGAPKYEPVGTHWYCVSENHLMLCNDPEMGNWERHWDSSGDIADSNLRPISGVPVTDEVTEDLKEPA